jgi:hypothetical protein
MDQATKAALAMGMFTGEADYRLCEDICVLCGIQKYSCWAGRARDPNGRMRGVCTPCAREKGPANQQRAIDYYLNEITHGRL